MNERMAALLRKNIHLLTPALRGAERDFGLPFGCLTLIVGDAKEIAFALNGEPLCDRSGVPFVLAYPEEGWSTVKHGFKARSRAAAAYVARFMAWRAWGLKRPTQLARDARSAIGEGIDTGKGQKPSSAFPVAGRG